MEIQSKNVIKPIEERLEKLIDFKVEVSKKLLNICKEVDEFKDLFKKFEEKH